MSFLDKIKGKKGRDSNSLDSDSAGMPLDDVMVLDRPAFEGAANAPSVEGMGRAAHMDSSIITEAAPSEIADFSETRLPAADGADAGGATGLPLVGNLPIATQQRLLLTLVGLGLVGLVGMTAYSLTSASKGAAQVAASGQALMQSQ